LIERTLPVETLEPRRASSGVFPFRIIRIESSPLRVSMYSRLMKSGFFFHSSQCRENVFRIPFATLPLERLVHRIKNPSFGIELTLNLTSGTSESRKSLAKMHFNLLA